MAEKVGILFLLGLVPGLNVIMWSGYAITIGRNIWRRQPVTLPGWEEWSDVAVRGLLAIAAMLIYFLPILLVSCCLWVGAQFMGTRNSLWTIVQCCGGLLGVIYTIAATLLLNVGHARYVQTDQFASYLEFGQRFQDFQNNANLFVMLFVLETLLSVIAGLVAGVLAITCVGGIAVLTMAAVASGYLLGSAAANMRTARG